jgi:hypothetical protein
MATVMRAPKRKYFTARRMAGPNPAQYYVWDLVRGQIVEAGVSYNEALTIARDRENQVRRFQKEQPV